MGARSSKTKPAQPDTIVESFSLGDAGDEGAAASDKHASTPRQRPQQRVAKEIWGSKHVDTAADAVESSPNKRGELQISSEEDSDAEHQFKALVKKKTKKKRRKGSREEQEPAPKTGATVKLNEVQVVKKPPGDHSPERQQRFEQIKVAYSIRDLNAKAETPSPSRAESKAESLARFFGGRDAKYTAPLSVVANVVGVARPKVGDGDANPPQSSFSLSCQSESSSQSALEPAHSRDEQALQLNERQSERDSTELMDIEGFECEEGTGRSSASSFRRTTLTPASKSTQSRPASFSTPQAQPRRLKSPAHSLRLDDADESIMSAILMEMPPRTSIRSAAASSRRALTEQLQS